MRSLYNKVGAIRGGGADPENGKRRTENRTRGKRTTSEVVYKAATAAVLVVLYVLYVLPRRPDCQNGKPPIPPIKAD